MNIKIQSSYLIIFCYFNLFSGIQTIDIIENSDEVEIYKHIFARLNRIIQQNEDLKQDIKQLDKRIELLESKLENKEKLKIDEELENKEKLKIDEELKEAYCRSTHGDYCFQLDKRMELLESKLENKEKWKIDEELENEEKLKIDEELENKEKLKIDEELENKEKLKIDEELKDIEDNVKFEANCSSTDGVYCFGGNWIIIQRRTDGSENFYRDWNGYKSGFGNKYNEFFIGLEKLYRLTSSKPYELLIVMKDFDNEIRYARYNQFEIASETYGYSLKTLGSYSGNAGDSLTYHRGSKFSTKDRDNDKNKEFNCAEKLTSAWWFKACHESNLNGCYTKANLRDPKKSIACGIHWKSFRGQWYSMKFVKMMIRPKVK